MLRATYLPQDADYFFHFDANFENIPLKLIETADSNLWEQVYSKDIVESMSFDRYLWRSTLINMQGNNEGSYIALGMHHNICDKSIAW